MTDAALVHSDEIDLIELLFSIWKKKWWVIILTTIFMIISIAYALLAREEWTSKAEVIAPRNYEISNILKHRLAYARITDDKLGDIGQSLYSSFVTELRSFNSRVDFFEQSGLFKRLTEGDDEAGKQKILFNLATVETKIQWSDEKKEIDYLTISFTAENPEDAQKTLVAYLKYLNQKVFAVSEQGFLISLNNHIDGLKFAIQRVEERLPLERNIKLETQQRNLERSLAIAKAAGIKELTKAKVGENLVVSELALGEAGIQLADDKLSNNNFLFLMGEKYLQAQIDNVNRTPLVFPADYYHKKTQLEQLKVLLEDQKENTTDQAFHYQSSPYLPLKHDKPKRALIVLVGTLIGGIMGVLTALFMSALESRKKQQQIREGAY